MKKVSFILLSLLILSISVNAQFAFSSTKIMLTQKDGDRDISGQEGDITPENAPKARSSVSQPRKLQTKKHKETTTFSLYYRRNQKLIFSKKTENH